MGCDLLELVRRRGADGWRAGFTLAKLPVNTRNAGNRSRAGEW